MYSIIVPVYNEDQNINILNERLEKTLNLINIDYEIIYINDGSTDNSEIKIKQVMLKNSNIKLINFLTNFGQHSAIIAGLKIAKGDYMITLDADLQNPPEEIPKLIKEVENNYDMICGVRKYRKDSFFRKFFSKIMNKVISKLVKCNLKDFGCMMRVYKRSLVNEIVTYGDKSVYIPAFAAFLTKNIKEVNIEHNSRNSGLSNYNFSKLLNQSFDLIVTYTLFPIQLIFKTGAFIFIIGCLLFVYLLYHRFIVGSPSSLTTFIAILILLSGIIMLSIGIVSEYLIRIYRESKKFPSYIIRKDD